MINVSVKIEIVFFSFTEIKTEVIVFGKFIIHVKFYVFGGFFHVSNVMSLIKKIHLLTFLESEKCKIDQRSKMS